MALQLECYAEKSSLSFKDSATVITLAHLAAPQTVVARPALSISAVIDRSGSMSGEKLDLVKRSMACVLKNLTENDKFGMVIFDDHVEVALPMTQMTPDGKDKATRALEFSARGSTNLSDGLIEGAKLIRNLPSTDSENPSAVWLFTDGEANQGIQDTPGLVALAKECMADLRSCALYTFGFGTGHNASMLRELASAGQGVYYYVEDESTILPSFGDCLGGLVSITAQNVQLRITTKYQLEQIHTSYPYVIDGENTGIVTIKDMYSEECRDILCTIVVGALAAQVETDVCAEFTVSYVQAGTKQISEVSSELFIERPEIAAPSEVPIPIDEQRNRLDCAEALKSAGQLADSQQLEAAREILNSAIAKIEKSRSASTKTSQGFIRSLQEALAKMRTREEYESGGQQQWCYALASHANQRSNVQMASYYGNSAKCEMAALFA